MLKYIKGLLSKGILAWRCYIIWGRIFWMKWGLMVLLAIGAGMFVSGLSTKSRLESRGTLQESGPLQPSLSHRSLMCPNHECPLTRKLLIYTNTRVGLAMDFLCAQHNSDICRSPQDMVSRALSIDIALNLYKVVKSVHKIIEGIVYRTDNCRIVYDYLGRNADIRNDKHTNTLFSLCMSLIFYLLLTFSLSRYQVVIREDIQTTIRGSVRAQLPLIFVCVASSSYIHKSS
jgi:hypothetical protein